MNVLVIGDTHIPFAHKNYLEFCKETQKRFKCDRVVHVGDLVDHKIANRNAKNFGNFTQNLRGGTLCLAVFQLG